MTNSVNICVDCSKPITHRGPSAKRCVSCLTSRPSKVTHAARFKPAAVRDAWPEIMARHDHKCVICGSLDNITVDRIIPRKWGGDYTVDNVQPMCLHCNTSIQGKW